jgi:hypothetical protein
MMPYKFCRRRIVTADEWPSTAGDATLEKMLASVFASC